MNSPPKKPQFSVLNRRKPEEDSIRKRMLRLKFSPVEAGPVNSREYGLMLTSRKTGTPYPRVEAAVDAGLLRARLSETTKILVKDVMHARPSQLSLGSVDQNVSQASVETGPGPMRESASLLLGTPHPRKGLAIDPKSLIRHLNTPKALSAVTSRHSMHNMGESGSARNSNKNLMDPTKITLKIGMPHLTKHREARASPAHQMVPALKRGQKSKNKQLTISFNTGRTNTEVMRQDSVLSIGSARHTGLLANYTLMSIGSTDLNKTKMTFEERRRLFDQAEFTIAKNGRKMSDVVMAEPQKVKGISVKRYSLYYDRKNDEELEQFIRTQGLIKTQRDHLTITKMPPTPLSTQGSETGSAHTSRRSSIGRLHPPQVIKFSDTVNERKAYSKVRKHVRRGEDHRAPPSTSTLSSGSSSIKTSAIIRPKTIL